MTDTPQPRPGGVPFYSAGVGSAGAEAPPSGGEADMSDPLKVTVMA